MGSKQRDESCRQSRISMAEHEGQENSGREQLEQRHKERKAWSVFGQWYDRPEAYVSE